MDTAYVTSFIVQSSIFIFHCSSVPWWWCGGSGGGGAVHSGVVLCVEIGCHDGVRRCDSVMVSKDALLGVCLKTSVWVEVVSDVI